MPDKIKMNYPLMEEMSKTFQQGAQQLDQTLSDMMNIANTLKEGALLGDGGSAFAEGITDKLAPAIRKISAKFIEESKDIQAAVKAMQAEDSHIQSSDFN